MNSLVHICAIFCTSQSFKGSTKARSNSGSGSGNTECTRLLLLFEHLDKFLITQQISFLFTIVSGLCRPVEVVESRTEYIEGDTSNGSTDLWDKEDPPFFLPQQPSDSHWPQGDSIIPRPKIEPRWPSGFGNRGESSNTPDLPGRPDSGHPGGVFGAFEDLVKETEDMAHSFLQVRRA
jgi:hypothetical protein